MDEQQAIQLSADLSDFLIGKFKKWGYNSLAYEKTLGLEESITKFLIERKGKCVSEISNPSKSSNS